MQNTGKVVGQTSEVLWISLPVSFSVCYIWSSSNWCRLWERLSLRLKSENLWGSSECLEYHQHHDAHPLWWWKMRVPPESFLERHTGLLGTLGNHRRSLMRSLSRKIERCLESFRFDIIFSFLQGNRESQNAREILGSAFRNINWPDRPCDPYWPLPSKYSSVLK